MGGGRLQEIVAHAAWTVSGFPPRFHFRPASSLCVKSLIQDLIIHLFQHFEGNKSICRLTLKAILRAPLSAIFSDKVSLPSTCRMTKER